MVCNVRNGPPVHLSKKQITEIRDMVLQTILDINAAEQLKHKLSNRHKAPNK